MRDKHWQTSITSPRQKCAATYPQVSDEWIGTCWENAHVTAGVHSVTSPNLWTRQLIAALHSRRHRSVWFQSLPRRLESQPLQTCRAARGTLAKPVNGSQKILKEPASKLFILCHNFRGLDFQVARRIQSEFPNAPRVTVRPPKSLHNETCNPSN